MQILGESIKFRSILSTLSVIFAFFPMTQVFGRTPVLDISQYELILDLYLDAKYDGVVEEYGNLSREHPVSEYLPAATFWAGMAWYVSGNYTNSVGLFTDLLRQFPRSPESLPSLYYLGRSYYLMDKNDIAVKFFYQYIQKASHGNLVDNSLFWIAVSTWKRKEDKKALAILDECLNRYPLGNKADACRYVRLLIIQNETNAVEVRTNGQGREKYLSDYEDILRIREEAVNKKSEILREREKILHEKEGVLNPGQ